MKNYWLDRKKPCNKRWHRIEMRSGSGHRFFMNDTNITSEKEKEKLECVDAKFEFVEHFKE